MRLPPTSARARLLGLAVATLALPASVRAADLTVAVTLPEVGLIVSAVAGDLARVTCVTPGGADPHSFTLSAQQVTDLRSADLVVFAGTPLLEFEHDLLASLRTGAGPRPAVLDWPDYQREGASLRDVPGLPHNPHGPWMDPGNAAAMARAIAARLASLGASQPMLQANLARFVSELDAGTKAAEALAAGDGPARPLVAVVPGVADVVTASGHPVALVLLPTEGASFASAADVTTTVRKLRAGDWGGLVCPEIARDSKPGEIARQVAADSGSQVYYVRFLSPAGPGWTYLSQMAYNTAVLARADTARPVTDPPPVPGPAWRLWLALAGTAVVTTAVLCAALVRARYEARHTIPGAGIFGAPGDGARREG